MSYPFSRRCVAKLCLNVCTDACFVIPAFITASLNALLQRCGVLMMKANNAASRVDRKSFCRKEPEPAPLFPCIRIFFLKSARQKNTVCIIFPFLFVYFSYRRYLVQKGILQE